MPLKSSPRRSFPDRITMSPYPNNVPKKFLLVENEFILVYGISVVLTIKSPFFSKIPVWVRISSFL